MSKDLLNLEAELLKRAKNGEEAATVDLLSRVEGTIVQFVKKYCFNNQDWEDAIQAGKIGALKAITRFNLDKQVRWNTYATYWIRAEVMAETGKKIVPPIEIHDNFLQTECTAEDEIVRKELVEQMLEIMTGMTDFERQVVEKRWLEEKTFEQISKEMGVQKGSLNWAEKRAMETLKRRMVA